MLPPAPVAAGRHPDAQGVRGTYARSGDEIGPVGKQLYWTYAAKCGVRVGGPGGGIPLPLVRRGGRAVAEASRCPCVGAM